MKDDLLQAGMWFLVPVLLFLIAASAIDPTAPSAYTEQLSSDFLKACRSDKRPAKYCVCVLEVFEDEWTEEDFKAIDVRVLADRTLKDAPDYSKCDSLRPTNASN